MSVRPAAGRLATLLIAIAATWAASAVLRVPAVAAQDPRSAVVAPNDPLFRHQWNLRAMQIPAAWAVSRGRGAVVAVLDTGVAYEDRGRYRRAPDLAGTRFVDGWDFVDDDRYPHDVPPADGGRSHGTLMAALIAQTTDNAIGGAGVAPAAAIMPVRVLGPDVSGSARAIARGVRFAADHGADIVNLSVAGPDPKRVLAEAVAYAAAKGVTIVAAAGNEGRSSVGWPAAYPGVIAVGAVTRDGRRARYSNYGAALDLVAPGGAGERVDTGYGPADGVLAQTLKGGPSDFCFCSTASTSAAAAQVSGVAALLVGARRVARPAQIRAALLRGARDLGPRGHDLEHGAGLVQAPRAEAPERAASGAAPSGERTEPANPENVRSSTLFLAAAAVAGLLAVLHVLRRYRRRA